MTISTHPDVAVPVTVSITRHVDPEHTEQMIAWIRAGTSLAERFPGFLGAGWVRPGGRSGEWHMLYRFAARRRWRGGRRRSSGSGGWGRRRGWWGSRAASAVPASRAGSTRRRSTTSRTSGRGPVGAAALEAGGDDLDGVLPAQPAGRAPCSPPWPALATVPRVLVTTLVMTPMMTYVVLPQLTRRLDVVAARATAPAPLTVAPGRSGPSDESGDSRLCRLK